MGRKINAAVLGASLILPGVAGALGLGDITLNSSLNQPLDADISLKQIGDLGQAEILTKLASTKEFERSGVDRTYFLNDIQFDVEFSSDGSASIHLTTVKPVVEPFLNFILEVQWPQGKLLKEFTLLLDPPVFSQEFSQPVAPPVSYTSEIQPSETRGRTATVGDVERPVYPSSESGQNNFTSSSPEVYGPVARNEGLWEIAKKVRPNSSLTIHQTMVALQEKNPNAFLRNNINLLKEGQVLRIPTEEEVLRNSYQDALSSVKGQNESWRQPPIKAAQKTVEPESESQLGGEVVQAPENESAVDGRLTLVAGSESGEESTAALGGTGAEMDEGAVSALQQELSLKSENLDKTIIENENLKTQLEELNEQLETSAEIVQLKDDQIATLQKQLAALEQKAKEKASLSPEPAKEKESTNALDNPLVLAGIGAAIVAMIVGLMLARRKSANANNEVGGLPGQEFEAESLDMGSSEEEKSVEEDDFSNRDQDNSQAGGESEGQEALNKEDSVKQELGDVIGEADIYIAYGRFSHAAELLKQGCDAEPEREDIRLKLLEVLAETGDTEEFSKHDAVLRGSSDETILQAADALYAKVYGSERSCEDDSVVDDPVGAEAELENEYPLETTFDTSDESIEDVNEQLAPELDLDFSANEGAETETSVISQDGFDEAFAETELAGESLDLESDLSGDLEFELPDVESNEGSSSALDLDVGDESIDQEPLGSTEVSDSETDAVVNLADHSENTSDVDDFAELELDGFGEETPDESASSSEEGFALDLDDMGELDLGGGDGELENSLELDLDGLADSLEEAGVDLSDAAQPMEDFSVEGDALSDIDSAELPEDSGLDLSDASTDEAASTNLSGDINLDEDDLDLLSDLDENATKLDLARAYLEMGDATGAKEILQEVLAEGNESQKQDAEEMLGQIA